MVGIGSLGLTIISAFSIPKLYIIVLAVLGVFFLVVAGYLAWRDEHRNYLAASFDMLIRECENVYKFAKTLKNPGSQRVFYPLSPTTVPDSIVLWEHKELLRFSDRMRQHTERVNSVFENRNLKYPPSCSFDRWGENVRSLNHDQLLQMLEDHKNVLEETREKMLQAS